MAIIKDEPISAEEKEFMCLICDASFLCFGAKDPVCPKCGAKGLDVVVPSSELDEEEQTD